MSDVDIARDLVAALRLLKIHQAAPNLSNMSKGVPGGWCEQRDKLLEKYPKVEV